ncbi:GDSL esterase/lipase 7-like [Mercurialis annua]|uniref:GDSL esterase/lipase 7-like n=1 Tax=Mercurialis annua TaxID=3986 RepID=UPI00215F81B8|nr:GDSL esterase/lipase 7-like [Mercurialis annua]
MAIIFLLVIFQLARFVCSAPLAPAFYIFGDSLSDNGNNNFLQTEAKADYSPYGEIFPSGATGRFSNGRNVADFIAEFLNLSYPPPSLSVNASSSITGVNYASGACGILPKTGIVLGKCLSLEEQLRKFEIREKSKLVKQFRNRNETTNFLSNSIFLFSTGSNDYLGHYLDTAHFNTSKQFSPQQYAELLVYKLSLAIKRVYKFGGRKFITSELGPLGCIPAIAKVVPHKGNCIEEINQLIIFFNENLAIAVQKLTTFLPGSKFVHVRSHALSYDAIVNPSTYGLKDTSNTCCDALNNGTSGCIRGKPSCPNPEQFYFFDAFHPTEVSYSLIASRCINDSSICSPTLEEFVKM